MTSWLRREPGGLVLELLVQPGARRTRAVGEHGGRLKIQVAAPPVGGAANQAVAAFLAEALGVRPRDVAVLRGRTGRRKTVRVAGGDLARAMALAAPGT